jgi:hypothetical protein
MGWAIASSLLCLLVARSAGAQSSGSFPEPAPPPPAPAPVVAPPPAPYAPPPAPYTPPPAAAPAPAPYTPPAGDVALAPTSELPLSLSQLPPVAPYHKGLPVPPGYRVERRSATGLIAGGGLSLAGAYGAALVLGASQKFENGMGYVAIPVIGPWAAIGGRTFNCKTAVPANTTGADVQRTINKCVGTAYDEVTTVVFLTADGLIQATGIVLFLVGLASGYDELVRVDLPKTAIGVLPEGGAAFSVSGNF